MSDNVGSAALLAAVFVLVLPHLSYPRPFLHRKIELPALFSEGCEYMETRIKAVGVVGDRRVAFLTTLDLAEAAGFDG